MFGGIPDCMAKNAGTKITTKRLKTIPIDKKLPWLCPIFMNPANIKATPRRLIPNPKSVMGFRESGIASRMNMPTRLSPKYINSFWPITLFLDSKANISAGKIAIKKWEYSLPQKFQLYRYRRPPTRNRDALIFSPKCFSSSSSMKGYTSNSLQHT